MSRITSRRSNVIAHFRTISIVLSLVVACRSLPLLREARDVAVPGTPPPKDGSLVCGALRENRKAAGLKGTLDQLYENARDFHETNGYLTYQLVKNVYEPACLAGSHESDIFTTVQCYIDDELPVFCWCADPNTGEPQNTTAHLVQKHLKDSECEAPKGCQHDGKTIAHGDQVNDSCTSCACYNGVMSCEGNVNSCQGASNMSSLELYDLRVNLLKKMYLDLFHGNPNYDQDLELLPTFIAIDKSKDTLPWKYGRMDRNNRGHYITYTEIRKGFVNNDVTRFTNYLPFIENFPAIVDVDRNFTITLTEWQAFFNLQNVDLYLNAINSLEPSSGSGSGFGK